MESRSRVLEWHVGDKFRSSMKSDFEFFGTITFTVYM